ncbi:MAG: type sorting protein, partial [Segetibacter sp.]|nr:type sorting protein [Segetibacter sp.]
LFTANNGTNGDEIWITDGTNGNSRLLKDINPGTGGSSAFLILSVKVGNRLIFSASNASSQIGGGFEIPTNSELWETDGTEAGTHIFKEIVPGATGSSPVVLPAFDFSAGTFTTALFQGNKFFFIATTPDKGAELWISDGSDAGTQMIKDINPNAKDGVTNSTYLYTTTAFYFSGDDGVHGSELWKSDGTADGTVMVADINPNADLQQTNSDVEFGMVLNNKIIFNANNGDNTADDLYRLEGTFSSLPLNLLDFTVISKNADANVAWTTLTEVNVKDFSVQRSDDGAHFVTIGTVGAAGNSTEKRGYRFTDVGIGNSNRDVVYYKLLINDKDGKSATSKIVSLRLKGAGEWAVKMVKNPVLSDINLLVTGVIEPVKVSVSDISGRAVNIKATVSGNGQITLSAANLVPGVYVLRAETSSDRKVIKFVKQ